jgi:hypothetical protein
MAAGLRAGEVVKKAGDTGLNNEHKRLYVYSEQVKLDSKQIRRKYKKTAT